MSNKGLIALGIIAGAAIVLYFFYSPVEYAALSVVNIIEDYVKSKTKLNSDGTVTYDGETPVDPITLATDSGVDVDVMSLARLIESEAGILPMSGRVGVAWASMNYAGSHSKSITELVTKATKTVASGYYGKQNQGRYCATSKDASQDSIDIAQQVISGSVADPTGGAEQWDSPWSYADPTKAETVAQSRRDAGRVEVDLPDVPSRKLRFWK